jgi:hypothetical protein
VRPRYLAFALSLVPALAQVGLLDGPRPPTEVRGTLQGNPRDGYKVAVEFLVDQGVEPLQGTVYQPLSWDGTLYLCPRDVRHLPPLGVHPGCPLQPGGL